MTKTVDHLLQEALSHIAEVAPEQAQRMIEQGVDVLDVRDQHEITAGCISGAIHISRGQLEFGIGNHKALQDKAQPMVVYCATGRRSALATLTLLQMGYHEAVSLRGGLGQWRDQGFPLAPPASLWPNGGH